MSKAFEKEVANAIESLELAVRSAEELKKRQEQAERYVSERRAALAELVARGLKPEAE